MENRIFQLSKHGSIRGKIASYRQELNLMGCSPQSVFTYRTSNFGIGV
ncbi:protein of unknown function [Methylotuvimicrobium alcaliphilum 20Z]|uniref:Uncharacterized protein n=1 Tax=Methylotuvimicrobium alcaliphilum (strain DSM 19304 / NCIMB 14124 / VKM B-2133 / 20Z) TaxID=1091494 RepID=G4STW7_META2|nr:protein of unknown function [Methylotuvimicrobium alcaliphilum 20Z]